jgi:prephenate dehydrogenase
MKVLIRGAGLIGGSIGLALNNSGHEVCLEDVSKAVESKARIFLKLASSLMDDPDVVIVAVPPAAVGQVIKECNRLFPNATLIDVASVMFEPSVDVDSNYVKIENWVSTHPMAGKENSGYENATYDLFKDRLWIVSPQLETKAEHLQRVEQVVLDCGAIAVTMAGDVHDKAVALTSHLPQILATVLAKQLNNLSVDSLTVSGQGLRDLTRIASSAGDLWNEILIANKTNVISAIENTIVELENMKSYISNESKSEIVEQFSLGNLGKSKIPGKHGGAPQIFQNISIEIDDKPGQLAGIFATAGIANVNIEDVRIDHALGKQVAIIELSVLNDQVQVLQKALATDGWKLRATNIAD